MKLLYPQIINIVGHKKWSKHKAKGISKNPVFRHERNETIQNIELWITSSTFKTPDYLSDNYGGNGGGAVGITILYEFDLKTSIFFILTIIQAMFCAISQALYSAALLNSL